MYFGLVPIHTVFELGRLTRIINHETLIVLRAGIHDLTEELERGECAGVVVKNALSVRGIRFAQNENEVDVRPESGLNTERVLHSDNEEHLQPATVHEEVADVLVMCPAVIVHTVVENHKRTWIEAGFAATRLFALNAAHDHLLALHEVGQDHCIVLTVDEEGGNHFAIKRVRLLCTADHSAEGHILMVKKEVTYESRLTCAAATNEDHHRILGDFAHIELFHRHIYCCRHFSMYNDGTKYWARQSRDKGSRKEKEMDTLRGSQLPAPRFRLAPMHAELERVHGFHSLQTFFPTLSKLYRLSKHQSDSVWLDSKWRISGIDISGTSGPCTLQLVPNLDLSGVPPPFAAPPTSITHPAYLKVTHLLDPIRWMKGLYSLPKEGGLPWHGKTWSTAWAKLQDPWNQAYVETLAAYSLGRLREEGVSPHFNHFYGAFCARAARYRYNITDDAYSLRKSKWFWNNREKGLYDLCVVDTEHPEKEVDPITADLLLMPRGGESDSEGDSGSESGSSSTNSEEEVVVDDMGKLEIGSLHSDALDDVAFEEEDGSDGGSSGDGDSLSSAGDAYRIYAEFHDFPVMLIATEENRGTMDSLLEDFAAVGASPGEPAWEERWSAWLFQVVAALSVAQDLLGFTHNDLHTNNVVWTETEEEYLFYRSRAGAVFRVPTFGKLFRLIDYGRAIFRINQNIFISDDFKAGNDAEGQYCFKPLHPRPAPEDIVAPNPSFDLCRLAVSLFESLFPDPPAAAEGGKILSSEEDLEVRETVSPLYNILWSWMVDDEGRNVLIEPDGEERFPDFDLYKHIAAHVHGAVPSRQFSSPAFDRFQVKPSDVGGSEKVWSLFC